MSDLLPLLNLDTLIPECTYRHTQGRRTSDFQSPCVEAFLDWPAVLVVSLLSSLITGRTSSLFFEGGVGTDPAPATQKEILKSPTWSIRLFTDKDQKHPTYNDIIWEAGGS